MKLKVVYRDITQINLLEENFKNHDIPAIQQSIRVFGFVDPVGFNPTTGNTFNGNGRTEATHALFTKWLNGGAWPDGAKIEPPAGIEVKEMHWLIPTVEIPMEPDKEVALAAALNRIPQLGGFDEALMLEVLQGLQSKDMLAESFYSDGDLNALLKRFPGPESNPSGESNGNPSSELRELTGAVSAVKQIALLFQPADHAKFQSLTMELAGLLGKTNVTDTVLAALQYAHDNLNPKAETE